MIIISKLCSTAFFLLSAVVVVCWILDYNNKNRRFQKKGIIFRTILILTANLFLVLMLTTTELSLKDHVNLDAIISAVLGSLPGVLIDFIFVDIPYLYMVYKSKDN